METLIQQLETEDLKHIWKAAFRKHNIKRSDEYFDSCLVENGLGNRVTLLAFQDDEMVGIAHLRYESDYPFFIENHIPEINDLNVFPPYRKQGIANLLMEEFELIASQAYKRIGIGVGLFNSYGAAQRIYCRRGYIPDGRGLTYENKEVHPGEMVRVDDSLNLFFVKELSK